MPSRSGAHRPLILEGAAALLESGLYADLTVTALAHRLHMSKSTLYRHFDSKEDLVVSLFDERLQELEQGLGESELDEVEPRKALRWLVELCARHAERLPRAALTDMETMPSVCQEKLERGRRRMAEAFRGVLRRAKEQGSIEVDCPDLYAEALCASYWAAMVAAARGDVLVERGEAVRQLLPLFRL